MSTATDIGISELEELISGPPPRCQTYIMLTQCGEEATVTIKIRCCDTVVHLCRRHFEWLKSGGPMTCTGCGTPRFKWTAL